MCRTALIRSALESPDPGASNGESNFEIRHFGADLVTLEMGGFPQNLDILNIPPKSSEKAVAVTGPVWFVTTCLLAIAPEP